MWWNSFWGSHLHMALFVNLNPLFSSSFSRLTSKTFVTWKVTFFRVICGTKIFPTLLLAQLTAPYHPPCLLSCHKASGLSQLQTDRIKDWIQFLIITVHLPTNNEWAITSSGRSLLTSSQGSSKWLKVDRSTFQCLSRTEVLQLSAVTGMSTPHDKTPPFDSFPCLFPAWVKEFTIPSTYSGQGEVKRRCLWIFNTISIATVWVWRFLLSTHCSNSIPEISIHSK